MQPPAAACRKPGRGRSVRRIAARLGDARRLANGLGNAGRFVTALGEKPIIRGSLLDD